MDGGDPEVLRCIMYMPGCAARMAPELPMVYQLDGAHLCEPSRSGAGVMLLFVALDGDCGTVPLACLWSHDNEALDLWESFLLFVRARVPSLAAGHGRGARIVSDGAACTAARTPWHLPDPLSGQRHAEVPGHRAGSVCLRRSCGATTHQ